MSLDARSTPAGRFFRELRRRPVGALLSLLLEYLQYFGGILFSLRNDLRMTADASWVLLGLKAFVAAVVGGIGNVSGAVVGGLTIGIIEAFVAGSRFSNFRDAIAFVILIAILLFRPSGLFGRTAVRRV